MALRYGFQDMSSLLRLITRCNRGVIVKGFSEVADSCQQPVMGLVTSAEPLDSAPGTEDRSGPESGSASENKNAPSSTFECIGEIDGTNPESDRPAFSSSFEAGGAVQAAIPPVGKYKWNKERTEREIRRAKHERDKMNRGERQPQDQVYLRSANFQDRRPGRSKPRWEDDGRRRDPPRASVKLHYPICLTNLGRLTSRRDVQRLLKDCMISTEDIRLQYDVSSLLPKAFYANLRTAEAQHRALGYNGVLIAGRPINIMPVGIHEMQAAILSPLAMGSKGRFVVVQGIQENANLEDVVRFFEGFELMGNPVTIMKRPDERDGAMEYERRNVSPASRSATVAQSAYIRALIRFATTEEAHRAMRTRQCCFLLNAPVTLRLLQ